jgi:hypothetical protein
MCEVVAMEYSKFGVVSLILLSPYWLTCGKSSNIDIRASVTLDINMRRPCGLN